MKNKNYEFFFKYHIDFQKGGYFNNEIINGDLVFYHSNVIEDPDWNFFRLNKIKKDISNDIIKIKEIALSLNRKPIFSTKKHSFIYKQIDQNNVTIEDELWMTAFLKNISNLTKPSIIDNIKIVQNDKPCKDFLYVFGNLFQDEKLNNHFRQYYCTALEKSVLQNGVQVNHVVAYINNQPVGCATVYRKDDVIGLYNVGTIYHYQKMGIGKWLSVFAAKSFGSNSNFNIFLQCVSNGYVPKMYKSVGFISILKNSLIDLSSL